MLIKTIVLSATVDSNFTDVKSGAYWYESIGIAKKLGISAEIGNNQFGVNSYITLGGDGGFDM